MILLTCAWLEDLFHKKDLFEKDEDETEPVEDSVIKVYLDILKVAAGVFGKNPEGGGQKMTFWRKKRYFLECIPPPPPGPIIFNFFPSYLYH